MTTVIRFPCRHVGPGPAAPAAPSEQPGTTPRLDGIPPYAEQLAHLARRGYSPRASLMLAQAARLSAAATEQGGWFFLPQSRAPRPGGGIYARLGGWREIGVGSERTQRRVTAELVGDGLLHIRRPGLGRAAEYRVDLARYRALFDGAAAGPSKPAAPAPQPAGSSAPPPPELSGPASQPADRIPAQMAPPSPEPQPEPPTDDGAGLPAAILAHIERQTNQPGVANRDAYRASCIRRARAGKYRMPPLDSSGRGVAEKQWMMSVAANYRLTIDGVKRGAHPAQRQAAGAELDEDLKELHHWREMAEVSPTPEVLAAIEAVERRLAAHQDQGNANV